MGDSEYCSTVLNGGEWSVSRPGRFTLAIHCVGGWMGLRAGLDAVKKIKVSCLYRDSKPYSSAVQSIT
jgi:hypothetical protein